MPPSRIPLIRFRLLTITMLAAFLLLGMKVGDVIRGGKDITLELARQATAQQSAAPATAQPQPTPVPATGAPVTNAAPAAVTTNAPAVPPAAATTETTPLPSAALDGATGTTATNPATPSESPVTTDATANPTAAAAPANTNVSLPTGQAEPVDPIDQLCTTRRKISPELSAFIRKLVDNPTVQDIVLSLDKRRDEIEAWAKQLEMKENMMQATEQRIGDKIAQIKILQKDLEVVLAEYNKHEDAKIRSLVKIYENMKPADAARIFDEMDMPILLEVVDKMSERKAAPILANMSPIKAKELTVELAEQRKLQQPMLDAISASQQESVSATPPTAAAPAAAN